MAKLLRREKFLLNLSDQKITIFPIAEGEIIEKGDFVVVNTRTLEASRPKQESGHYAVGQAVEIVTNEYGVKMVICKDGIFIAKNTEWPKHQISDLNNGRVCYFDGSDCVTLNNINTTKAGIVLAVTDKNRVVIKICVDENGGLEW